MWFTWKPDPSGGRGAPEQVSGASAPGGPNVLERQAPPVSSPEVAYFDGKPLPEWSISPISRQRPDQSEECPDVDHLVARVVEEQDRVDNVQIRSAFIKLIAWQMDDYLESLEKYGNNPLRGIDFPDIRAKLIGRDDFEPQMLVEMMTYFGPAGVAGNNIIALNFGNVAAAVRQLIDEGQLD